MDWDEAEAKARAAFVEEQETATFCGEAASDDYIQGSKEGWDAAITWIKRQAMNRLLGD